MVRLNMWELLLLDLLPRAREAGSAGEVSRLLIDERRWIVTTPSTIHSFMLRGLDSCPLIASSTEEGRGDEEVVEEEKKE